MRARKFADERELPITQGGVGGPECRNHQFQRVIDFIARERPDFVWLAEVTAAWEQLLISAAGELPRNP